jgi:hypothetical protein
LEVVKDQASFLEFVCLLKQNRTHAAQQETSETVSQSLGGANGWANVTIEGFLDGAIACLEDHGDDGMFSKEPTWRTFAEFLYCGKVYD